MTASAPVSRPRIPRFTPVPVRRRDDGWTPLRQAEFIGMLAQTGSVAAAARFVGMARETAYRLRGKPGAQEFAAAWDASLAHAGKVRAVKASPSPLAAKVTHPPTWRAIVDGRWRVVMRGGEYAGSVREPHNSVLLGHLAQLDRALQDDAADRRRAQRSQAKTTRAASTSPRGGVGVLSDI